MKRFPVFAILAPLFVSCVEGDPAGADPGASASDASTDAGEAESGSTGMATGDSSDGESSESGDVEETGEVPEQDGVELFAGLCAPCHGPEGEGTALAYELRHPDREHATWVVRNGRPGVEFDNSTMIAFGPTVVSDAQLEEIWDWLDSFPQPTTGESLYADYCRNCHGEDAAGGAAGKDISDKEAHDIREKVRQGEGLGDVGARALYMPARSAERLTDAQIDLIAAFIAGE